ncbi:MAG: PAS domain-containing protein [Albidovulum sp.]
MRDAASDTELAVLSGMLAASNDACWCMEFGLPVDLATPDAEVERQIFENDPVWRHCNQAMARLYHLPAGADMNARPVHEIFPRNRQNEDFIRNLIASGFEVDAAPALDRRYDGMEIYVENDVRAHIVDGMLLRMFGTVRNVAKHRRREAALQDRLKMLEGLIAAIPVPVLAIDPSGIVEEVNVAAARWLGRKSDLLLGHTLEESLNDTAFSRSLPAASNALHQAATLGVTATFQAPEDNPTTVWHVEPRETGAGTGFVVLITPIDGGRE